MDPTQTLQLILDAMVEHDHDAVRAHSANLRNWLQSGGFAPDFSRLHLSEDDLKAALTFMIDLTRTFATKM